MTTPKFTVAIVGGGVAGLTTAIAISRFNPNKDINIDIYEGAQAFTDIGAGVGLWLRPWNVMKKLGLTDDLSKICKAPSISYEPQLAFQFRKSDQPKGLHYYDLSPAMGLTTFHRPEFLDCLASNLPKERVSVHFTKRLVSYTETPNSDMPFTLKFRDGSTSTCHVLIGADGVHSPTRRTLLELAAQKAETAQDGKGAAAELRQKIDPVWSGLTAYRMVISAEKLKALNPHHGALTGPYIYNGKGKNVAAYPVSNGRLVNIAAFQCYREHAGVKYEGNFVTERTREQLLKDYEGWEEEVTQLLQCAEKPHQWVVLTANELPIWTHGAAAILGDAAHAMTPNQGSGAGQAIEDAYVLGSLLGHPAVMLEHVPVVMEIYQQVRLPHANKIQRLSAQAAWVSSFQDPRSAQFDVSGGNATRECTGEDVGRLWDIQHGLVNNWKWAWTTSADDDCAKAMKLMEERLGIKAADGFKGK